jgi:hypothetical protein
MCPIVSDVWKLLGIHKVLAQVCSLESEGGMDGARIEP